MLVYFAILLTALLGISGLVIDVGRIELRSLELQAAADSAALSAAAEYQRTNGNLTTATIAANSELATYASLNGIPVPTPTVTLGATSGYYQNDGSTLQVSVTQAISTTMLSLIKGSHSTINAGATAVAMIPPCIYLMGHPSFSDGNNLNLASQIFRTSCPIYSTTGYTVDGFSKIRNWQAKASGPASLSAGGGGSIKPALIGDVPLLTDPLAYITAPAFSGCTPGLTAKVYSTSQTISPATYCGGLTISGSTTTITMLPGRYIITGGVTISSGATVTGDGVTMYLTKGGGSGFGSFSLQGGSKLYVNAPVDNSNGGIPAILLMTDRTWSGGVQDIKFDTSTFQGDGLLYITGTGIYNWLTPMSGSNYFGFVASNLYFFGANIVFSCNYSQLPGGNPFRTVISLVQ